MHFLKQCIFVFCSIGEVRNKVNVIVNAYLNGFVPLFSFYLQFSFVEALKQVIKTFCLSIANLNLQILCLVLCLWTEFPLRRLTSQIHLHLFHFSNDRILCQRNKLLKVKTQ